MIGSTIEAGSITGGSGIAIDYGVAGVWHRSGTNQYYAVVPKRTL